jgi:cell division protein FtsI (penicillin-binding protein 3)
VRAPKPPPLLPPTSHRVSGWIGVIVVAVYLCLVARLFQLQVLEGRKSADDAEEMRSRPARVVGASLAAMPVRGRFLDREGRELATGHYEHRLTVDLTTFLPAKPPKDLPADVAPPKDPPRIERRKAAARADLARALPGLLAEVGAEAESAKIRATILEEGLSWAGGERRTAPLARRLTPKQRRDLLAALEARAAAGADAEERATRRLAAAALDFEDVVARAYPYGELTTQILGVVGASADKADPRVLGRTGLEKQFERALDGDRGVLGGEQTCGGVRFKLEADQTAPAIDGADVRLTIDVEIQRILVEALRKNAKTYKSLRASAVVLDAKNGEILGIASIPTTEPGEKFNAAGSRLGAVEDSLEPGSTIKPIYYAYAFHKGRLRGTEEERFDCGGWDRTENFQGRTITDYSTNPQPLNAVECLYRSSNIGSVRIAIEKLGVAGLYEAFDAYRLFERPGSGLLGEAAHAVYPQHGDPKRALRPASIRWEVCSFAQGYGLQISPLALATAYTVFASGGDRIAPTIVKEISRGGRVLRPEERRTNVVSRAAVDFVRKGMLNVVEHPRGTAHSTARSDKYVFFGKTGTSQFDYSHGVTKFYNAWMGAVAPAADPRIVVVVVHHKVGSGVNPAYTGGAISGPVVREIVERTLEKLGVAPDRVEDVAQAGGVR